MSSNRVFNVVVEGNIGSGKTTLLDYFRKYQQVCILPEPVELWRNCKGNNLLGLLYEDINEWAFSFQSYVMLTVAQQQTKPINSSIKLLERSIYSAKNVFIEKMARDGSISSFSSTVLDNMFEYLVGQENMHIDLILYLRSSPEVVYKRMMERNRNEEKSVPLEYLQAIHDAHENWLIHKTVGHCPAPVLVLDANLEKHMINSEYDRIAPHVLEKIPISFQI